MQSTTVDVIGRGTNPKNTLYVGGLEERVTKDVCHAAFIPFGDITDISVPLDHATGKHRGFAFIQYEDSADAEAALDNMNNAELYGRTLKVNFAAPNKIKGGDKGWASQPVWADVDSWQEKKTIEEEVEKLAEIEKMKAEKKNLQSQLPQGMRSPDGFE